MRVFWGTQNTDLEWEQGIIIISKQWGGDSCECSDTELQTGWRNQNDCKRESNDLKCSNDDTNSSLCWCGI